jgi:Mce-associated membrane protein
VVLTGTGIGVLTAQVMAAGPAAAGPPDPVQLAACDFEQQLGTYSFTDYDTYNQRVLDHSTGAFHDGFQSSSADRRNRAMATHSSSEVLSVECRTDTADTGHAQVVVSMDDTTRSDVTFGLPVPQHSVVRVYLDNIGGRWLTDRVDPVPQG